MSKELTRKRKSPEPSLGDAVNPELTCGNMRLHPNTVLGCTHLHTIVLSRHTHRNKETVSSWHQEPQGGEGVGRKYPLKGYIPRDIYSLRRRLGFQTSSSADGQIITFLMGPPIHTPGSVAVDPSLGKNKSKSVRKFSQNHCWGLWWSLIIRKCLAYWLAPWAGKTYLTLFSSNKNLLQSLSLSRYVMNCYN